MSRNAQVIVVAFLTAAVTAGAPAVAGVVATYAKNAGKVDGIHAVRSKASLDTAAGKLVAHNRRGVIPKKFVPNAGNASTLDNLDSSAFAASGHTHVPADAETLDGLDSTELMQGAVDAGTCTIPAGGSASAACSFSFNFSSTPIVIVTVATDDVCCNQGEAAVINPSPSGFTIKTPTGTGGSAGRTFNYLAVLPG